VVVAELLHAAVAIQIRARVADVREIGAAAMEPQRRQRRAHSLKAGIGLRSVEDGGAGRLRRFAQAGEHVFAIARVVGRLELTDECVERHARRALARLMATHAISDGEQSDVGAHEVAVLVVIALFADVGERYGMIFIAGPLAP